MPSAVRPRWARTLGVRLDAELGVRLGGEAWGWDGKEKGGLLGGNGGDRGCACWLLTGGGGGGRWCWVGSVGRYRSPSATGMVPSSSSSSLSTSETGRGTKVCPPPPPPPGDRVGRGGGGEWPIGRRGMVIPCPRWAGNRDARGLVPPLAKVLVVTVLRMEVLRVRMPSLPGATVLAKEIRWLLGAGFGVEEEGVRVLRDWPSWSKPSWSLES